MNPLAVVWIYLPPWSEPPALLGSLEVSRRGTLDFGGGAAGDHRLPSDQEVRTEGRTRDRLYAARLLPGLFDHGADDQRADDEHRGDDRQHQVLTLPGAGRRSPLGWSHDGTTRPAPAPGARAPGRRVDQQR